MKRDEITIFLLVSLVIIIIVIIAVYYIFIDPTDEIPTQPCSKGWCPTNLFTGIKRCSDDPEEKLVPNPIIEVCNPSDRCTNTKTPYAVQLDNSTRSDGQCPDGENCRCLRLSQCASFVTSKFQTFNGNPYLPIDNQRLTIGSTTRSTDRVGRTTDIVTINEPSSEFCAVPLSFINRAIPGCSDLSLTTPQEVSQCMSSGNSCLQGTLAFLWSFPNDPNQSDLMVQPLSCVRDMSCPEGQLAYWSKNQVQCLPVVPS